MMTAGAVAVFVFGYWFGCRMERRCTVSKLKRRGWRWREAEAFVLEPWR